MTNDLSSKLVAQSIDVTGDENFLQGCSFSPDGLCVLTASVADSQLRLYNTPLQPRSSPSPTGLPLDDGKSAALSGSDNSATSITDTDWKTVLSANGGDTLRCYTWYPGMASSDPSSCCFLAAARYESLIAVLAHVNLSRHVSVI